MQRTSSRLQWAVWGAIGLTLMAIASAFLISRLQDQPSEKAYPVLFEVPEFALTNQHRQMVTRDSLLGHVWIADIVFTRCAGPCPTMTRQMAKVQAALPSDGSIKLVTLTTDPDFDTPAILNAYARQFGADSNRWWFLTGAKRQITNLAVDGLKLVALEKDPKERQNEADLFIHSTLFVLVDKRGRVRGLVDPATSTLRGGVDSDDPAVIRKLTVAARALARER